MGLGGGLLREGEENEVFQIGFRMKISTPQLQQFLLYYTQISPQGVDLREARDVLRLKRWVRARRFCYSRGLNGKEDAEFVH